MFDESDLAASRWKTSMPDSSVPEEPGQLFCQWDLVRFFHENPYTTDTADNIARYLGRDLAATEQGWLHWRPRRAAT
jgi:hypothetical protein